MSENQTYIHFGCQILIWCVPQVQTDYGQAPAGGSSAKPAAAAEKIEDIPSRGRQERLARLEAGYAPRLRHGGSGTASP
eukprot:2548839-Pyramimonas_sp.AAC.1